MAAESASKLDPEIISGVARTYSERHGLTAATEMWASHQWGGDRELPTLHLDDVSGIPFLSGVEGVDEYQHRARIRCGDGDIFATVTEPAAGYEDYCRQYLGLGAPEHVFAHPENSALEVSNGCGVGATYQRLIERTRESSGLLIEPYMGIEDVWQLAQQISSDSGCCVQMVSPPPEVTWVANDKTLFSELVADVLGEEALVVTRTAHDVPTLVGCIREISSGVLRVAIKRPRCASAMGNRLLHVEDLVGLPDSALEKLISDALASMDWPEGEEVIACVWEETDLSPSTQWWVPPRGHGAPRIDGIYEQILEGEEKLFVGSRPSNHPKSINDALVSQSRAVVMALQELGYVGRCSFDHLIVGDPEDDPVLRLTECNGRWGGTSTPMHLVDRVIPGKRPPYRAQDFIHKDLIGVPFTEICDRIGDHLYDARTGEGQFLLYNVGPLLLSGKFDVIGIGNNAAEADQLLTEVLPELLGV